MSTDDIMVSLGEGKGMVNHVDQETGKIKLSGGRIEVMRLRDPTDAAAVLMGAICIAHHRGQEGISFTPKIARLLAALLIKGADDCDALIAIKAGESS